VQQKRDYYEVLGLGRDASESEIKGAFRNLAHQYHPDKNPGDKRAEDRFKEINEAYEVLSDPEKRKRYDMLGADWSRYSQQGFRPGGQDFQVHFGQAPGDFDLGGFSDFFKTFFGDLGVHGSASGPSWGGRIEDLFGGARTASRRGENLQGAVEISLEEAHAGTKRIIELETDHGHRRLEVKIPPGVKTGSDSRRW